MRQVTRSRYYGRSAIAGSLRTSATLLVELANDLPGASKEPPLVRVLRRVVKSLQDAVGAYDIYKVNRRRLRTALLREQRHLTELLALVVAMPVLPEEKVVAKNERAKAKASKKAERTPRKTKRHKR